MKAICQTHQHWCCKRRNHQYIYIVLYALGLCFESQESTHSTAGSINSHTLSYIPRRTDTSFFSTSDCVTWECVFAISWADLMCNCVGIPFCCGYNTALLALNWTRTLSVGRDDNYCNYCTHFKHTSTHTQFIHKMHAMVDWARPNDCGTDRALFRWPNAMTAVSAVAIAQIGSCGSIS